VVHEHPDATSIVGLAGRGPARSTGQRATVAGVSAYPDHRVGFPSADDCGGYAGPHSRNGAPVNRVRPSSGVVSPPNERTGHGRAVTYRCACQ
jgi:hypothetical protein